MPPIQFTCPGCGATMKTNNPALAGKKIKCPKCQTPIPVPAAPGPAEFDPEPVEPQGVRKAPARGTPAPATGASAGKGRKAGIDAVAVGVFVLALLYAGYLAAVALGVADVPLPSLPKPAGPG